MFSIFIQFSYEVYAEMASLLDDTIEEKVPSGTKIASNKYYKCCREGNSRGYPRTLAATRAREKVS